MGMGIHDVSFGDEGHRIGQMLSQATKVIKSRGSTGAERDLFFTSFRGFDSHAGSDPAVRKEGSTISPFDHSINRFKQEMEAEGLWGTSPSSPCRSSVGQWSPTRAAGRITDGEETI